LVEETQEGKRKESRRGEERKVIRAKFRKQGRRAKEERRERKVIRGRFGREKVGE
jgi:hypothetical protein